MSHPIPVRMPTDLVEVLDRLAADMAGACRPEVVCTGARWGRSALIRLLVTRGAVELQRELDTDRLEAGSDGA
jgi:hypothetical protein